MAHMDMTDITELRTEGKIAADKGLRVGHYCLEAADEIERLRKTLSTICGICLATDKGGGGQGRIHAIAAEALNV